VSSAASRHHDGGGGDCSERSLVTAFHRGDELRITEYGYLVESARDGGWLLLLLVARQNEWLPSPR
jgi:hypothetical protein